MGEGINSEDLLYYRKLMKHQISLYVFFSLCIDKKINEIIIIIDKLETNVIVGLVFYQQNSCT